VGHIRDVGHIREWLLADMMVIVLVHSGGDMQMSLGHAPAVRPM
jgi:hypothetical protein